MPFTLKKTIHQYLESNDLEAISLLAKTNRKVLSRLVRFAYDKETLTGWRAIKAIGLAAQAMLETDYEYLRDTCRKLLWSLSDESGGIGWSAPEILGEIVSADPARFDDLIPLIAEVYDIEEKVFRPGILYALGRIAEKSPDSVLRFRDLMRRALAEGDTASRIYALDLLALLKDRLGRDDRESILESLRRLASDQSEAWIYRNTGFVSVSVGEYARTYINKW